MAIIVCQQLTSGILLPTNPSREFNKSALIIIIFNLKENYSTLRPENPLTSAGC
jgi:hypothetical protein